MSEGPTQQSAVKAPLVQWTVIPRKDGDMIERLDASGTPPMSVWRSVGVAPRAIILIGHGGSQHRRAETVEYVARAVLANIPAYVVAIDGPVHGDRLKSVPEKTRDDFVALWLTADGGVPAMVADWNKALAAVRTLDKAATLPVGYYGVSMGTAFGIPLLAAEPSIRAAVIGMWAAGVGETTHLETTAPDVHARILFIHRSEDQFFPAQGAEALFALLGTDQKSFVTLPGPHEESDDQMALAAEFLAEQLLAS